MRTSPLSMNRPRVVRVGKLLILLMRFIRTLMTLSNLLIDRLMGTRTCTLRRWTRILLSARQTVMIIIVRLALVHFLYLRLRCRRRIVMVSLLYGDGRDLRGRRSVTLSTLRTRRLLVRRWNIVVRALTFLLLLTLLSSIIVMALNGWR